MRRPILVPAVALALTVATSPADLAAAEVTVVHAGTLLAVPGEPPRQRQTIVVREGRISEVRDGLLGAAELGLEGTVEWVDLSDAFVLPGLIDLHTHVLGELGPTNKLDAVTKNEVDQAIDALGFLRATLDAGFTTIRNTGGHPEVMFALRRGVAAGKIAGPRIFAAGAGISGTGGHADVHGYVEEILALRRSSGICDGAEDCRRAVRQQIKRGSDWIKITATGGVLSETAAGVQQQLFDDELEAIVRTAAMMGRAVAAHAHGTDGINAALRAGVRTIEHGTFADESSFELFLQQGAYLVPTLLAGVTVVEMAKANDFMPAPIREKALAVGPQMLETLGAAYRAGVAIAFGTDSGVSRHGDNAREFALMVEAGMSEMDAIASATVVAAEVLGISDDSGTIEPGKRADLVGVAGDPLAAIDALTAVDFVMKDGRIHKDVGGAALPTVDSGTAPVDG